MRSSARIVNDYLIFLDSTRIDHLVTNFNTSHSKEGQMPSASVSIGVEFEKALTDTEYRSLFYQYRNDIYMLREAVKEKTNLTIFIKNVVSGKFVCVFNGTVSDVFVSTNRSQRSIVLNISGIGGIMMMHEIESLLSVPFKDIVTSTYSSTAFKLQSRTLDVKKADHMIKTAAYKFNEMTISEMVAATKDIMEKTNKTYVDTRGVMNFNAIIDRVKVYSDIDKGLLSSGILDSGFTTDALKVESLYVTLAKQTSRLMMEFYEMPDGEIVIKAPYWNAPVLQNHIIPDIAIIEESTQHRWSQRVTRVTTQGDVAFPTTAAPGSFGYHFVMPMASYTESLDGTASSANLANSTDGDSLSNDLWQDVNGNNLFQDDETGLPFFDSTARITTTSEIYLFMRSNSEEKVVHSLWPGVVYSVRTGKEDTDAVDESFKEIISRYEGDLRDSVIIKFTAGPYIDCFAVYVGVSKPYVKVGQSVKVAGTGIGMKVPFIIGETYKYNGYVNKQFIGGAPNLAFMVLYPDFFKQQSSDTPIKRRVINPKVVLRDMYADVKVPTSVGLSHINIDAFSNPTDIEMLYGMRIMEEVQPLIKFDSTRYRNDQVLNMITNYSAFRYKTQNASVNTMSLTLIPMPWLKPGLNLWVDPTGLDEVYYISNVSHVGSPGGVFTNLYLTMGRDASTFFNGNGAEGAFGTIKAGGTYGSNMFMSKDKAAVGDDFAGSYENLVMIRSYADANGYKALTEKMINFKTYGMKSYNIEDDPFMRDLFAPDSNDYVGANKSAANQSATRMSGLSFKAEMTEAEIQNSLTAVFSNTASSYVQLRALDISKIFTTFKPSWKR